MSEAIDVLAPGCFGRGKKEGSCGADLDLVSVGAAETHFTSTSCVDRTLGHMRNCRIVAARLPSQVVT